MTKVLIIEDNSLNADNTEDLLKDKGYQTSVLFLYQESILEKIRKGVLTNKIAEIEPAVVLIDGLEGKCLLVAETIKNIDPRIICVIVSFSPETYRKAANEKGYTVLEKSERNQLLNFLGRAIGK